MLPVHGQHRSFSTHERVFLGKCQSFWDKCLDLRVTRTSNLRTHAECSNLLSYQGQGNGDGGDDDDDDNEEEEEAIEITVYSVLLFNGLSTFVTKLVDLFCMRDAAHIHIVNTIFTRFGFQLEEFNIFHNAVSFFNSPNVNDKYILVTSILFTINFHQW